MLITLQIHLLSEFLANRSTGDYRMFNRHPNGTLALDFAQWDWALRNAERDLYRGLMDLDCIKPARGWTVTKDQITLHTRNYTKQNRVFSEVFECVNAGQVIRLDCHISQQQQKTGLSQPEPEDLFKILNFVGEYYGLSPWGSKFGYGRFEIINNAQHGRSGLEQQGS